MNKRMGFAEERAALDNLKARIPDMQCVEGCSACCGPVPFSRAEWGTLPVKPRGEAECATCPFVAEGGGCKVHRDRPILCRLFGTVDDDALRCPKGARPAKYLTAKQGAEIRNEYRRIIAGNRHTYGPFRELFRRVRKAAGWEWMNER